MPDVSDAAAAFDPAAVVRALDEHGVDYVLIGGVAARLHGSPSLTEDIDLTPEPSRDNLGRLATALDSLGARLAAPHVEGGLAIPLDAATFTSPVMTFETRAGQVDVVRDVAGLGGHEAVAGGAVDIRVAGVVVRVAALDDIIASKVAANRPKDRAHLDILRTLAEEIARAARAGDADGGDGRDRTSTE